MKYMFMDTEPDRPGAYLRMSDCFIANSPTGVGVGAHITRTPGGVYIEDVTIFAGNLTRRAALVWAICGLLRLGDLRVARIRRTVRRMRHPLSGRRAAAAKKEA